MSPNPEIEQGAVIAVSAAFGAAATAIGRFFLGARTVDKVDAVAAVAAAFDKVAERTNAHVDDLSASCNRLQERVDYLEREIRKRDELLLQYVSGRRQVPIDPNQKGTP